MMHFELKDISISQEGKTLFEPISCQVEKGQCVTIMGSSGSGKSTLLDYIGGSLPPIFVGAGHVMIDGVSVENWPAGKRQIGILFQDDLLFPHMTVRQNLEFGLSATLVKEEKKTIVCQALDDAQMVGFAGRDPASLSGGQRARISCLRMLLANPRVILLDEPFSKLDQDLRIRFRAFVFGHARKANVPVLLVTHDHGDAEAANGPVITLK